MRTRMILAGLMLLAPSVSVGQKSSTTSDQSLLRIALTSVQARSQRSVYGFRASPPPLFRAGTDFYVDVADLNRQLRALGLSEENVPAEGIAVDDVRLRSRSWSNLESCAFFKEVNARRCTLPHGVKVVRLRQLAWVEKGVTLKMWISIDHRTELGRGLTGIGGRTTEYTFALRDGKWELSKVGGSIVS